MKNILIIAIFMFSYFTSMGQKVISFNTTFYGNKHPYCELYMSNDSVFLEDYKQNKLKYTPEMFALPDRQKFMFVSKEVFEIISDFLLQRNENIEQGDFAQPFREIYYVKIFDYSIRKSQIITAFGHDKSKAFAFFNELKEYLEKQQIGTATQMIKDLDSMLLNLDKR